ncbi:MAG TPA: 2,3-diphosphoglycerate synthetase [Actinomycetota bacterium]|nr:2,3-diphosphoglycerate synthetase [Actinomycetota bacterium]
MIEAALAELARRGRDIVAAVLAGGREKLPARALDVLGGVPLVRGDDPRGALADALADTEPDEVLDLSDEPVLDYRRRHELAAVALACGVPYRGHDFSFTPPPRPRLCRRPSIAVVGTGKRTGKTAVAGFAARTLAASGRRPVVVAMGRGGPPEPEVLRGDDVELDAERLVALADEGRHAASDYVEDALLARVPTVGCRRCGGGLAGGVELSNVPDGVRIANDLPGDVLLLEGSGSALPPVHADVTILVIPASIPAEYLEGYMGPYRMLISDIAIVTMCEDPFGSPSRISEITSRFKDAFRSVRGRAGGPGDVQVVRTVFRPTPTRSVHGARAYVATTAPAEAGASMRAHLERAHGCTVVGMTHALSNRSQLETELKTMATTADVLLCEIKAAGIDVAARAALDAGLEVVFVDNVPHGIEGDDPDAAVLWAADAAARRFEAPA